MTGPLLTLADLILCRHGGRGAVAAGNSRVTVAGAAAILHGLPGVILDCPGDREDGGRRCVVLRWLSGTTRVHSQGLPLVTALSQAITSAGPVIVAARQARVLAG